MLSTPPKKAALKATLIQIECCPPLDLGPGPGILVLRPEASLQSSAGSPVYSLHGTKASPAPPAPLVWFGLVYYA